MNFELWNRWTYIGAKLWHTGTDTIASALYVQESDSYAQLMRRGRFLPGNTR